MATILEILHHPLKNFWSFKGTVMWTKKALINDHEFSNLVCPLFSLFLLLYSFCFSLLFLLSLLSFCYYSSFKSFIYTFYFLLLLLNLLSLNTFFLIYKNCMILLFSLVFPSFFSNFFYSLSVLFYASSWIK